LQDTVFSGIRAPSRRSAAQTSCVRSVHEESRDQARQLAGTPQFATSLNERKKVEMLFAHLKTTLRFERMRLRGLTGARDEFHLAAMVQNLRRMARLPIVAGA
jgi:Transposase DDE domain